MIPKPLHGIENLETSLCRNHQVNRPYARKIKLAEFDIKKSGLKSYLENPKGKPGNHGV